jgi:hypothetical protein
MKRPVYIDDNLRKLKNTSPSSSAVNKNFQGSAEVKVQTRIPM